MKDRSNHYWKDSTYYAMSKFNSMMAKGPLPPSLVQIVALLLDSMLHLATYGNFDYGGKNSDLHKWCETHEDLWRLEYPIRRYHERMASGMSEDAIEEEERDWAQSLSEFLHTGEVIVA